jgi:hypothetical protein
LVNCRKAYWCPAAPEARSATTVSAAVAQPPTGVAVAEAGRAGVELTGLLGAGVLDGGVEVGLVELATGDPVLDGAEVTGTVLEAGAVEDPAAWNSVLVDEHAAVSTTVAPSSRASRRCRTAVPAC